MFFKKFCFIFLVAYFPLFSKAQGANFFKQFSCFEDMKNYYPYILEGNLSWEKQQRFFRCLHDSLELIVNANIIRHDPSRDHFTKIEIFRLFNMYFEYDEQTSQKLTDQVFAIKKLFIGGSADRLKDQEIADFYRLVYDYQEIYYIMHEQIPVFKKVFFEKNGSLTPQQREKALEQLRKAFIVLERAYVRENIVYPIDDLHKHSEYLNLLEDHTSHSKSFFWYAQNLLEGLLFPRREIKGKDWKKALHSFHSTVSLFLYYKTYFKKDLPALELAYRKLESMELFLSSLRGKTAGKTSGFPLKNLDEIFNVLVSFFSQASDRPAEQKRLFANLLQDQAIPLLTRTITCFSLSPPDEKNCESKWERGASSPALTVSFTDSQFQIFSETITRREIEGQKAFIDYKTLDVLKKWLNDYKASLLKIDNGEGRRIARERQFDHWLYPFFGWEQYNRIEFGSFQAVIKDEKVYQLLHYQAFLPLLLFSYLPEDFWTAETQKGISFKAWKNIIRDLSPILAVFLGEGGYKSVWTKSLFGLFQFADSFLYSSNQDLHLNSKELVDLTVHLLEGVKTVQLADKKLSSACAKPFVSSCAVRTVLKDQDILSAYPRFQDYLFHSEKDKYASRMTELLGGRDNVIQGFGLLPLFILIQTMEINYAIIDQDQSFNLESDELLLFAKKFEKQVVEKIPYLSDTDQARSYLMYSFKTGNIPFFTGGPFTPVKFTNWHLSSKKHKPYQITPNEFHFLVFDFYNLYKRF